MITIFKNINETDKPYYISVSNALARIKDGKSKDLLDKIRTIEDKEKRNEMKKKLPSVCFGGKFSSRADNALIKASGFISLDFDGFKNDKDLASKRFELEMDDYTYACFTSPSGNGVKVLVKIPSADSKSYKAYFKALQNYYNCEHFDKACSNISRVTYESYDPEIYINEQSLVWSEMVEEKKPVQSKVIVPIQDEDKTIEFLHRWWEKDYGLTNGSRNHNLFILASAYNQYGIHVDKAIQSLTRLEQPDFKASEITNTIRSAYNNTAEHNTKKFEDKEKLGSLVDMVARNVSVSEIKKVMPEVDEEDIKSIEVDPMEFWIKSRKDMRVSFINHKYREFLVRNGFHKYYPSDQSNFFLLRISENIVREILDDNIRDFVFDYLHEMEDKSMYDAYADKIKLGKDDFLGFLPNINPKFLRDGRDYSYLYFRNCAIRVTANGIERIPYEKLDGYIWARQKIDRDFVEADYSKAEYRQFLKNISGNDPDRLKTMESTTGYLLHNYNNPSYNPAVILNDEMISDKPEGGTGKGIFVNAIGKLRKSETIDGKKFDAKDKFQYQRLTADTQLLAYQDVEKNFNFESLFSMLTDGMTVEGKNQKQLYFPFEKIPKVVITTNHAIKGDGNSHARRKWELEFTQYYKDGFTPLQEFGHQLFDDWSAEEWMLFDNYMISNIQLYLSKGLIKSRFKNLEIRRLEASTSSEFREWVLGKDKKYDLNPNFEYLGQDLLNDFCMNYPDYGPAGKIKITHRTFYRWIDEYAKYKFGTKAIEGRNMNGKTIKFEETDKQAKLCI